MEKHMPNWKKLTTFSLVWFLFSNAYFARAQSLKDEFLRARGDRLYLGSQEFREIGLNFYKAFRLYLDEGWDYRKGGGREFARNNLEKLAQHDFRIIRVMGPFHPFEFYQVFFDDDAKSQDIKRKKYLAVLNEFLNDCERLDIWVEFDLMWNPQNLADLGRHSLHEGLTNSKSLGYRRFFEYINFVVENCRTRKKIIWGIGNEYNLLADLAAYKSYKQNGVLAKTAFDLPGVYRGSENNFNSHELAAFYESVIKQIKIIDSNHLVVTGDTAPRPNAWHLLSNILSGGKVALKEDSLAKHESMLILLNKDADMISSHYYYLVNKGLDLNFYQKAARRWRKPLFLGEVGASFELVNGKIINANYADIKVANDICDKVNKLVKLKVPISLIWTYDCLAGDDSSFKLCYGMTDKALGCIENANKKIKKRHR